MENHYNKNEDLWKSNTIFEKIFKFAPDSMIILNSKGQIVCNNGTTEKIFEYTEDELLGKTIEILIPEHFRELHLEHRKEYLLRPHLRAMGIGLKLYGRCKDGTEFPVDIMLSPLETDNELFVLEVVRDITEQKKIEEELHNNLEMRIQERTSELAKANESLHERTSELAKANESLHDEIAMRQHLESSLKNYAATLEEANRVKDLFADIMRYNILDPLMEIKTVSESLTTKKMEEDATKVSLMKIKNNVDKLTKMIKRADQYSKLETTRKLEKESLDLNLMFRTVIDNFKYQLTEKKIELIYLVKNECYAMVNPIIEDVFSNLLSNAIEYSPTGSKIEIDIIDDNNFYKIYIKDWAAGIKDEEKIKLFTTINKEIKGGTELALVNRVVNLHEGSIWIEDNPEGGSIFFVKLPKT